MTTDLKGSGDMSDAFVAALVPSLLEIRARRLAEEQAYKSARRAQTVKVQFPDGIREAQAFFEAEDRWANLHQGSCSGMGLTPCPIDGWEFRGVIGSAVAWHAIQVPTDAQRRESERRWRDEYQIPYSDRNDFNEDY